ncbi:PASTA domain-containing protein [Kribbella sp. NBC_01510]|uniref:hypothetical protein n=1 Tax=Kribbella sp. NBC_01510 TaxID=2903581 RepID=UPI0038647986
MTLTTPSLASVTAGEPVTAQGWNAIVTGLTALYDAVIALGGETLDVAVTRSVGTGTTATTEPLPTADVLAEPLGEGHSVQALPPFGTRTAHLLGGLTNGTWRVHIQAPGFTAEIREVTIPHTEPLAVTLTTDGVETPDLFGLGMRGALDKLRALGIDADLVLDTTGREISRVAVPAEYVDAPVLAQLPAAGAVVPSGTGRVRMVVSSALRREPVVTMPSLAGLTLSEAQQALGKLGLRVGTTTFRETAADQ